MLYPACSGTPANIFFSFFLKTGQGIPLVHIRARKKEHCARNDRKKRQKRRNIARRIQASERIHEPRRWDVLVNEVQPQEVRTKQGAFLAGCKGITE